jgi:anti-anti-sigma regulatory factor
MPEDRRIFKLPERYSFDEDTTLKVFLHENMGANVEIASQNLRRIDSLFIQYLIAAARKWEESGLTFELTELRAELVKSLELLGVQTDALKWSAAE